MAAAPPPRRRVPLCDGGGADMITEPEMADGSGQGRPGDVRSDADESPRTGGGRRRRPWIWALGGIVVASAVWAAALRGTDYGHTAAPDLHGYHLDDSPCTSYNLQPLV